MLIKVPDYFGKFKCIAERCKDSCCIGWEITVDEEARHKYTKDSSDICREIVEKTQHGCFPLENDGRCAFLDENGLCRIISTLGDGYLCDICREHPRYYGIGKDGLEGGLGLGCEEAARLILASGGKAGFEYTERESKYFSEDEYSDFSDSVREDIYKRLGELGVSELIRYLSEVAAEADEIVFDISSGLGKGELSPVEPKAADPSSVSKKLTSYLGILAECEALSDGWKMLVEAAKCVDINEIIKSEKEIKSLFFYFTHRYVRECVEDMSCRPRILFALFSALSTIAISKVINTDEPLVRAAVEFSKNIEYSTENVDMILDELSEFL